MPVTLTGMGEVFSLAEARQQRSARRRALAEHAVMHPALRWLADEDDGGFAHRRTGEGYTVCGAAGQLVLASGDTLRCPDCYPGRAAVEPR